MSPVNHGQKLSGGGYLNAVNALSEARSESNAIDLGIHFQLVSSITFAVAPNSSNFHFRSLNDLERVERSNRNQRLKVMHYEPPVRGQEIMSFWKSRIFIRIPRPPGKLESRCTQ
jgi:hypothetical protein